MLNVLSCVKKYESITKSEIIKLTGLNVGTVNSFVGQLEKVGLVEESGVTVSTGGRKAIVYRFCPNAFFFIGVSIHIDSLTIGLFDYNLSILEKTEISYKIGVNSIDKDINTVVQIINDLILKNKIPKEKMSGIGLSVPGLVDYKRGVILDLPHIPTWKNIPVSQWINAATDLSVLVDNNNNCNVLALKWTYPEYAEKNLIYVSTVEGIGVGVVINGEIYRGKRYMAGEIGHITVNPHGEECTCGNRGCIELYASDTGICRIAQTELQKGAYSILADLRKNGTIDMSMLVLAARMNDPFVLRILDESTLYISICIENTIKTYDPDYVVLDIPWLNELPVYKSKVIDDIFLRTRFIQRDDIQIDLCNVTDIFLKGAANLIVDRDFNLENTTGILNYAMS